MAHSPALRQKIFDKTDGRCHLCRGALAFDRYGREWEVEHGRPRAHGGSDSLRNLWPAHVTCNRAKQTKSARQARERHGYVHAPRSTAVRSAAGKRGATVGVGAACFLLPEPTTLILGGIIGRFLGRRDPR